MVFHYKRAIVISILAYLASFVIGILLSMFLFNGLPNPEDFSTNMYLISGLFTVLIAGVFSLWYFEGKAIKKPTLKEGLYFGLILLAVSFLADMLIVLITLLSSDYPVGEFFSYYADPTLILSLILMLATTMGVGAVLQKYKK